MVSANSFIKVHDHACYKPRDRPDPHVCCRPFFEETACALWRAIVVSSEAAPSNRCWHLIVDVNVLDSAHYGHAQLQFIMLPGG
jgi:hypothetical protein